MAAANINSAEKRKQEELILKRGIDTATQTLDDKVTLTLDINGIIASREGKDTHVVISDNVKVIRSDGKPFTIQINGWYK